MHLNVLSEFLANKLSFGRGRRYSNKKSYGSKRNSLTKKLQTLYKWRRISKEAPVDFGRRHKEKSQKQPNVLCKWVLHEYISIFFQPLNTWCFLGLTFARQWKFPVVGNLSWWPHSALPSGRAAMQPTRYYDFNFVWSAKGYTGRILTSRWLVQVWRWILKTGWLKCSEIVGNVQSSWAHMFPVENL